MTGDDLSVWFFTQLLRIVIGSALLGVAICGLVVYLAR